MSFNANKLFNDFDTACILTTLVNTAKAEGYTIRKVVRPPVVDMSTTSCFERFSARNNERGVKLSFEVTLSYKNVGSDLTVKAVTIHKEFRSNRGRYLSTQVSGDDKIRFGFQSISQPWMGMGNSTWRDWLDKKVAEIKRARGETVTDPFIDKAIGLKEFKPLKFDQSGYVWGKPPAYNRDDKDVMSVRAFYSYCRVKGFATILPDLRVNIDETSKPGAEPWFFIVGECISKRSGASPEIIVSEQDGELVFYPVRKGRVTNDLQPLGTYIDFSQMSEIDGALVEKAIAKYLEAL